MSYSGDAAEQVVRMTLEGSEVAIRLAGSGAKEMAALLYAILHDQQKTKGKTRLVNMLRSGKELKVFAVKDQEMKKFCTEAKKYGVLYCVLKDKSATDGITDIFVRAEDAAKINRIFERFDLSTVDLATVKKQIEQDRSEKTEKQALPPDPDMGGNKTEEFLDALLSPAPKEAQAQNPTRDGTAPSRQSGPTLESNRPSGHTTTTERQRPSVREELAEIKARQGQSRPAPAEKRHDPQKPMTQGPKRKRKAKTKAKER